MSDPAIHNPAVPSASLAACCLGNPEWRLASHRNDGASSMISKLPARDPDAIVEANISAPAISQNQPMRALSTAFHSTSGSVNNTNEA
ncbi:MAG: hypothetical protein IANPNBLG_00774 [Bryobacteraceae bacterium]|nr:hypothetical protein [Bryobacteraceae bacterium]